MKSSCYPYLLSKGVGKVEFKWPIHVFGILMQKLYTHTLFFWCIPHCPTQTHACPTFSLLGNCRPSSCATSFQFFSSFPSWLILLQRVWQKLYFTLNDLCLKRKRKEKKCTVTEKLNITLDHSVKIRITAVILCPHTLSCTGI